MIHCIGDSHASVFSGQEEMQPIWPDRSNDILPWFKSYRIGPATAYQLNNKLPIINEIISKQNKNDVFILCFGEVDIRAHLINQMSIQNKTTDQVIAECVGRYFVTIKTLKDSGINVGVWGPIASWNETKPYLGGPSFGTNLERNKITELFTNRIDVLCSHFNIPVMSIFKEMLNEDGTTKAELLDDWKDCHIHLNQKAMPLIVETFKERGLL